MIKSAAKLRRRSPDPKTSVQVFVDDIGKWKAPCLKNLQISSAEKKGPGRKGGMFLSRGGRERAHPIPCANLKVGMGSMSPQNTFWTPNLRKTGRKCLCVPLSSRVRLAPARSQMPTELVGLSSSGQLTPPG